MKDDYLSRREIEELRMKERKRQEQLAEKENERIEKERQKRLEEERNRGFRLKNINVSMRLLLCYLI